MYVICVFVYYFCLCPLIYFVSISFCVCLYVNCILYTLIYVHIFSYIVNKLEIRWVYLSPIEDVAIGNLTLSVMLMNIE